MTTWLLFNVQTINLWYATAGLVLLTFTAVIALDYFLGKGNIYRKYLSHYFWLIVGAVTIGGVSTTLLYSEVLGFVPCSLCWLQRIALYSQVFLLLMAFRLKDTFYFPRYGITLSLFGLAVGIYHYIYQSLPKEVLESSFTFCLSDGSSDCADKVMDVFGFVTFPLLSSVLFVFLITIYYFKIKEEK